MNFTCETHPIPPRRVSRLSTLEKKQQYVESDLKRALEPFGVTPGEYRSLRDMVECLTALNSGDGYSPGATAEDLTHFCPYALKLGRAETESRLQLLVEIEYVIRDGELYSSAVVSQ